MKKNIVIMKSVAHDYIAAIIVPDDGDLSFYEDNHVVLTDQVLVEFNDLPDEYQVEQQVAIIDKQITKVMADSEASLTALKGRKQELLAICSDKRDEVKK